MQLTGEQLLPVARDRVWAALLDTETLRAAIPGCESVTAEGEGRFAVSVVAAVGPVKARFKGRLQQQDLQPPARYTLSFEGDGGMAGFARGSAEVALSEAGADGAAGSGHTRLSYTAQAQIGGRLAQIGSRLVDATAARMSAQFFERLTAAITQPAPAPAGLAVDAAPSLPPAVLAPAVPRGVPAVGVPAVVPAAGLAGSGWSAPVVLQMPAWAWSVTVCAAALLAGWLGSR
ncbi:MAG: carbon monoxide dehydrogenase [Burkholderiaceae bacterium]|jgi:carbon monoxide dehydrogenase subunit G|nr:MAG: carbon monoxide dehydrogenase [Burkholderiaceae bacterium]